MLYGIVLASVCEIHAYAEPELTGIDGIARHREVIAAEPVLVDMAAHHEETCLVEFAVQVHVAQWIVAYPFCVFALDMERHGGRLVEHALVFCVIVTVYSELQFQSGDPELKEHVAVDAQHRQPRLVGRCLICDPVVPVPYSEAELLVEPCGEHLDGAAVLLRET